MCHRLCVELREQESVLFHRVGSTDQTRAVRLGGRHLYPMNCLANLREDIFQPTTPAKNAPVYRRLNL